MKCINKGHILKVIRNTCAQFFFQNCIYQNVMNVINYFCYMAASCLATMNWMILGWCFPPLMQTWYSIPQHGCLFICQILCRVIPNVHGDFLNHHQPMFSRIISKPSTLHGNQLDGVEIVNAPSCCALLNGVIK